MIYDVIIVGTGAGGATVAHELSNKGLNILILEKGVEHPYGTVAKHIKTTTLIMPLPEDKEDKETMNF